MAIGTKCKICGKIHRLGECMINSVSQAPTGETPLPANIPLEKEEETANSTTYRYRDKAKRREYMKRYMREWRKKRGNDGKTNTVE